MAETQRRVSSREFAAWQALRDTEPWGRRRADLRAAIVASVVWSAQGGEAQRLGEFMPPSLDDAPDPPAKTDAEIKAIFGAFVSCVNESRELGHLGTVTPGQVPANKR